MALRPPSGNQWRKGARLLHGKRVHLEAQGAGGCTFTVRGDTDTYHVSWTPQEGWFCSCPVQSFRPSSSCSHIAACWLVWQAIKGGQSDAD